jgi:hypothetical protein
MGVTVSLRTALVTVEDAVAGVDDALRAVESLPFAVEGGVFTGGNNSCVIAMTISDRNSARKKRLSIMERDHSRRRGTDDSEEGD